MTEQERKNKIKELEKQIAELKAMKIEEPQSKLKSWKPNTNEKYWLIRTYGQTDWFYWVDDENDNWHYLTGNCFKTKEEAEEYKKKIEYIARYKNYIEEHSEPLYWNDIDPKRWYAKFNYDENKILVDYYHYERFQGVIYASSEQIIWDAINYIGEDNFKKYVLGVK